MEAITKPAIETKLMPERVEIPNLTPAEQAQVDAYKEYTDWRTRTQIGFLAALLRKGKPFTGVPVKPRKPTKHQRDIASARARSEYLVSVGRSRKSVA